MRKTFIALAIIVVLGVAGATIAKADSVNDAIKQKIDRRLEVLGKLLIDRKIVLEAVVSKAVEPANSNEGKTTPSQKIEKLDLRINEARNAYLKKYRSSLEAIEKTIAKFVSKTKTPDGQKLSQTNGKISSCYSLLDKAAAKDYSVIKSSDATQAKSALSKNIKTLKTDLESIGQCLNEAKISAKSLITVKSQPSASVTPPATSSRTIGDIHAKLSSDNKEGIIIAGHEEILTKIEFVAVGNTMNIKKMKILIANTSSTATTTQTGDEIPSIKLYNGDILVGGPYYPNIQGPEAGTVQIEGLNLPISRNEGPQNTLTIKGNVGTIPSGADSGARIYAHLLPSGFEACNDKGCDTSIETVLGKEKVVYKSQPVMSPVSSQPNTGNNSLTDGQPIQSLRFRVGAVSASPNGNISWKKIQFKVSMINATMSAASLANTAIVRASNGQTLALAAVYSGESLFSPTHDAITGGHFGYVTLILAGTSTEVWPGYYEDYDLKLTFSDISPTDNSASAQVSLNRSETLVIGGVSYDNIEGSPDGFPSFIWSDLSIPGIHATSSPEWANGVYVLPSDWGVIKNTLQN